MCGLGEAAREGGRGCVMREKERGRESFVMRGKERERESFVMRGRKGGDVEFFLWVRGDGEVGTKSVIWKRERCQGGGGVCRGVP